MDLIRRAWTTPRFWRYVAVGAIMFTIGTGTVAATSTGITQIVSNAGGFIAGVNSNHELLVNDASANGHLGNIDTASGTTNTDLSSINSKLGSTLTVAGNVGINAPSSAFADVAELTSTAATSTAPLRGPDAAGTQYVIGTILYQTKPAGDPSADQISLVVVHPDSGNCAAPDGIFQQFTFNLPAGFTSQSITLPVPLVTDAQSLPVCLDATVPEQAGSDVFITVVGYTK